MALTDDDETPVDASDRLADQLIAARVAVEFNGKRFKYQVVHLACRSCDSATSLNRALLDGVSIVWSCLVCGSRTVARQHKGRYEVKLEGDEWEL